MVRFKARTPENSVATVAFRIFKVVQKCLEKLSSLAARINQK